MAPFTYSGKTNASIVGQLTERNDNSNGISAAVVGRDLTTDADGPSRSYGGFFNSIYVMELFCNALNLKSVQITENFIIDEPGPHPLGENHNVSVISCYNTSHPITVSLPPNPENGRVIFIRRNNSEGVTIQATGTKVILGPLTYLSSRDIPDIGDTALLIFDGTHWCSSIL